MVPGVGVRKSIRLQNEWGALDFWMGHRQEGKRECLGSEKARDELLASICPIYKMASQLLTFLDSIGFQDWGPWGQRALGIGKGK